MRTRPRREPVRREQYKRIQAVACPACGMRAGVACLTHTGDIAVTPHMERVRFWRRELSGVGQKYLAPIVVR